MTFDEFNQKSVSFILSGRQLVQLYKLCLKHEETLDEQQRGILDDIRARLYDDFSIAQLEQIETEYIPN